MLRWIHFVMSIVFVLSAATKPVWAEETEEVEDAGPAIALEEAAVHVLSADGVAVVDAEVVLVITRKDGTEDRRISVTGSDGVAKFPDVRLDCKELRAVVRAESGSVEGKPRACSDDPTAFVVLPGADLPLKEDVKKTSSPDPETEEEEQEPEVEELEPVEPGLFALSGSLGVDFCNQWFYKPNQARYDVRCKDVEPVGFQGQLDFAVYILDWLAVGLDMGYRYYGSPHPGDPDGEDSDCSDPSGTCTTMTDEKVSGSVPNHLFSFGLELLASWTPGNWVFSAKVVPLGVYRQIIASPGGNDDFTELFLEFGAIVGYRFWRATWLGLYGQIFQPMPWIDEKSYGAHKGIASIGVAVGSNFGSKSSLTQR
ncbi:MAG: hypothetical protein GY854_11390 [Deltaproteobacteria bacterium]|nr:hypothetical protein [Deltaproteobacteria bacterium]